MVAFWILSYFNTWMPLSTAGAIDVKKDDFFDYDRQMDLEGFNSNRVYDTLSKQSRGVTQTIGKHKDDMKLMYQKIANQTESLKGEYLFMLVLIIEYVDWN